MVIMNKDELGVEIHNQEELLRIYEMNKNKTQDKSKISEWDKRITKVNAEIASLKDKLSKLG